MVVASHIDHEGVQRKVAAYSTCKRNVVFDQQYAHVDVLEMWEV
jgi:hypothetical protein